MSADGDATPATPGAERPGWFSCGLHLSALCTLAVAQPLFDVFGSEAGFFVARNSQPLDMWLFALVPAIGIPLVLLVIERLLGLVSRNLGYALHLGLVGFLFALLFTPSIKNGMQLSAAVLTVIVTLIGVAAAFGYAQWAAARSFLSVLSTAALILPGVFLFSSDARLLLQPDIEVATVGEEIQSGVPVVFVILDELPTGSLMRPDGTIDAELFPNFAALASQSTWYRNFTSNHESTVHALPILLTGRLPKKGTRLAVASEYPESLFTLLGGSYRMMVRETATNLCPTDLISEDFRHRIAPWPPRLRALAEDVGLAYAHVVLPEEWTEGLPSITDTWGGFLEDGGPSDTAEGDGGQNIDGHSSDVDRVEAFRDFIASLDDSPEPTLYFLHVVLPHGPWIYSASGLRYADVSGIAGTKKGRWLEDEAPPKLGLQRHLLQLGRTDRLLGELLDRLHEVGLYDRCLLVVAADHGICFETGLYRRQVRETNVREIMHVPLFIKLPGQTQPALDDRNAESIDLVPTIADALGTELPWEVDGQSVLDDGLTPRPDKVIFSMASLVNVDDATLPETWPPRAMKQEIFGLHPSWSDIEVMPSRPGFVGRRVEDVATAKPMLARVSLKDGYRFKDVDPSSGFEPIYLRGRVIAVEGTTSLPSEVAVAVNGTVRAVVDVFGRTDRAVSIGAMLGENAFVKGANDVRLLAVVDDQRLAPIGRVLYRYRLVTATSGVPEHFEDERGNTVEIAPGSADGLVILALASTEEQSVALRGWAADLENGFQPDAVLVVIDGNDSATLCTTSLVKRKVGNQVEPVTGFRTALPIEKGGATLDGRLRAFAVIGDRAFELKFGPKASWAARQP